MHQIKSPAKLPLFTLKIFLIIFILISGNFECSSQSSTEKTVNLFYKSIVYILPSAVSSTYWHDTYGDRIFFYTEENLEDYQTNIDNDFKEIAVHYNTVIFFLPCDTSVQFLNNLTILNTLAGNNNLSILFNVLPDEDYYEATTYLKAGTANNIQLLSLMDTMADLSQTWKIAVWYGWDDRTVAQDVVTFYNNLPQNLQSYYACWLDEEFIMSLTALKGNDFLVITEWYQSKNMETISALFTNQMVITGYEGGLSTQDWANNITDFLIAIKGKERYVGIWIFYDIDDGSGEEYTAFYPLETDKMANPWINFK